MTFFHSLIRLGGNCVARDSHSTSRTSEYSSVQVQSRLTPTSLHHSLRGVPFLLACEVFRSICPTMYSSQVLWQLLRTSPKYAMNSTTNTYSPLLTRQQILLKSIRSPISSLPGTWHSKYTNIVLRFHTLSGRRIFYVDDLHKVYGDVVRIGPSEVAVADIVGASQIHKVGSGFLKSEFYAKLTPTREPGIFAMQIPQHHAARRKLFSRAFSNSSLRNNWEAEIRRKTSLAVDRIEQTARAERQGVDVLKWWTLMATDMITHLSFGESFGMLEQGKVSHFSSEMMRA